MSRLIIAISCYLIGLLIFYAYATFDTRTWDIVYFGWSKLFDVGVLMWAVIFYWLKKPERNYVRWVFYFSIARFLMDVQTFITGVSVNNEVIVAVCFLLVIVVIVILTIKDFRNVSKR